MLQNKRVELKVVLNNSPNFLTQLQNLRFANWLQLFLSVFSCCFFPQPEWQQTHLCTSTQTASHCRCIYHLGNVLPLFSQPQHFQKPHFSCGACEYITVHLFCLLYLPLSYASAFPMPLRNQSHALNLKECQLI